MQFEDEPYVRIYMRDTKTWLRWRWEGQTVFVLTSRKLDRAGVLDDITDPVADVALITGLPEEVVRIGLERVIASGTFELRGARLVAPRYVEGQTAIKSDRLRAAELRKRRRDFARAGRLDELVDDEVEPVEGPITHVANEPSSVSPATRDAIPESRDVAGPTRGLTSGHAASRAVTPSLAYPSLADPNQIPLDPPSKKVSTGSTEGGKRPKAPRARTQCPLNLQPDATTAELAWTLGFTEAQQAQCVAEFIDWWRGDGRLKADWQATLRNRLRVRAEQLSLKPRKPRDERFVAYQTDLRRANEPVKDPIAPSVEFDRAVGGLFGG